MVSNPSIAVTSVQNTGGGVNSLQFAFNKQIFVQGRGLSAANRTRLRVHVQPSLEAICQLYQYHGDWDGVSNCRLTEIPQ